MNSEELYQYINSLPYDEAMDLMCKTCGWIYGCHIGLRCPSFSEVEGGTFELIGELEENNPNVLFQRNRT